VVMSCRSRSRCRCLALLAGVCLSLVLGAITQAQAQAVLGAGRIIGDRDAQDGQRPVVLRTGNGVDAGVSRNVYRQFDVGPEGAILNNARTEVATQLGGMIQGNPWLVNGPARVILNEINASDPSQLRGVVEVAGQRAEVIIANPAGIAVDGGGFLNAAQVTLSTGRPVLDAGDVTGYALGAGALRVDGAGLDLSQTDYTRVLTRSLYLNAGLWARRLEADLGAAADGSLPAGPVPQFALDVSALGGMYADKIVLVGTEHGLGVRNAGQIGAQAGELVVTLDGRIENTGRMQSAQAMRLTASDGVSNTGAIQSAAALVLHSDGTLDNRGGRISAAHLEIDAAAFANRDGQVLHSGEQTLLLRADAVLNVEGRLGALAAGESVWASTSDAAITDATVDVGTDASARAAASVADPPPPFAAGHLSVSGILDNSGGRMLSAGAIDLASAFVDNRDGLLVLGDLHVAGRGLDNRGGQLQVQRDVSLDGQQLDNRDGRLELNHLVLWIIVMVAWN